MLICQFQPKAANISVNIPTMTLAVHEGKLVMLDWQTYKNDKILAYFQKKHPNLTVKQILVNELDQANIEHHAMLNIIHQINEYLAGKRKDFDIELDLSMGTLFQQKVWQALTQIPYGQTISYAQLAKNIGQPTAYRAVANANGKNPIALLIPCHRVVASNGGLGGYTGGIDIKRALLAVEKSEFNRNK